MLIKLKDVCTTITDGSHYSPVGIENGYPMLSVKDMGEYGFDYSDCKFISKEDYEILIKNGCKPMKNDILIAKDGSYLKEIFVIEEEKEEVILSSIAILRPNLNIVNSYYLAYYLKTSHIKEIVSAKYVTGSVLKRIILKNFENIEIDLPNKDIQDKIANILSNIDNQIKRNNAIIKRLQDLAQTTYSKWFNQFEFPNNEGKPYKSDGGELVYNEELGREIPIDWEVKTLGDIIKKVTPNFSCSSNLPTIDLSVMPSSSFMLNELNESKNFTSNLFAMEKGNILFGSIRPYLKKAGIAPCNGVVAGTVHQYKETDKDFYNFALMTMVQNSFFDYALQVATGTKMPVVSSDNLLNYKVPFNKETVKKFQDSFNLVGITCNCVMQNQELNKLKEKLLPLLINGQLNI